MEIFGTDIDLNGNELKKLRAENMLALPTATSNDVGRIIMHIGLNKFYGYNGFNWVPIESSVQTSTQIVDNRTSFTGISPQHTFKPLFDGSGLESKNVSISDTFILRSTSIGNVTSSVKGKSLPGYSLDLAGGNTHFASLYEDNVMYVSSYNDFMFTFNIEFIKEHERNFIGLSSSNAAWSQGDPSSKTNIIGLGYDEGDTNFHIILNNNSGSATKIDTGLVVLNGGNIRGYIYQVNNVVYYDIIQQKDFTNQDLIFSGNNTGLNKPGVNNSLSVGLGFRIYTDRITSGTEGATILKYMNLTKI